MTNNLQSLFQKIKIDTQLANLAYIYYDKTDGTIHKISSRKEVTEYEILEIERKAAESFLTGEKKTGDYQIAYDVATKKVILKHINEKNSLATYDKVLYQIPKHSSKSADLIIVQDLKNSVWNISIDNTTLEFIKAHGLSLYDKILLSVTKKDDPNILYRTLYIELGMLIEKAVKIPFKFDFEFHGRDVSIYTNKYFDSYAYKVIG